MTEHMIPLPKNTNPSTSGMKKTKINIDYPIGRWRDFVCRSTCCIYNRHRFETTCNWGLLENRNAYDLEPLRA